METAAHLTVGGTEIEASLITAGVAVITRDVDRVGATGMPYDHVFDGCGITAALIGSTAFA
jgi:hypothetical protein